MIKIEKVDVWGFQHSIRGARNSYDSWDKSDSEFYDDGVLGLGKNDLQLFKNLYNASKTGNHAHRKPMRQIFVSMDVTAPLYWWKEFDQYKVGTVTSSCSTMHTIHKKEFELDDFSHEHLDTASRATLLSVIERMNTARKYYIGHYDNVADVDKKEYWWQMIQLLPSSYNQKRTVSMDYENVINIIIQRTGHKLDEWNEFIKELYKLPYMRSIIGINGESDEG